MELSTGKWTNKMLAEWFGIQPDTFRKSKQDKLEILRDQAEFYEDKGKIIITKVYEETEYSKTSKNYKLIKKNFDKVWKPGELNTCKRASEQLNSMLKLGIADKYSENLTRDVRTELQGKPAKNDEGIRGYCDYQWCKKDGAGNPVEFSDEENAIKKELLTKYFGTAEEKAVIVKGMIIKGEIRPDEAWSVYEDLVGMNNERFMEFLGEFQAKIGAVVIKATRIQEGKRSAFKMIEE